jgi:hypothetical protein
MLHVRHINLRVCQFYAIARSISPSEGKFVQHKTIPTRQMLQVFFSSISGFPNI